jgi:hypothetical protein
VVTTENTTLGQAKGIDKSTFGIAARYLALRRTTGVPVWAAPV